MTKLQVLQVASGHLLDLIGVIDQFKDNDANRLHSKAVQRILDVGEEANRRKVLLELVLQDVREEDGRGPDDMEEDGWEGWKEFETEEEEAMDEWEGPTRKDRLITALLIKFKRKAEGWDELMLARLVHDVQFMNTVDAIAEERSSAIEAAMKTHTIVQRIKRRKKK